jgi:molecular chaperone GrpE
MSKKEKHIENDNQESLIEEIKEESVAEEIEEVEGTLSTELEEAKAQAKENWERVLRTQAELDNIKRRAEKDVANAHKFSLEKLIKDLLPVIDSLEMALNAHPKDKKADFAGVELTYKMFLTALEKQGVKQLDPLGDPFNPHEHEAVNTQVAPDQEADTVMAVMQKGYSLYDRLVRPALVTVSSK